MKQEKHYLSKPQTINYNPVSQWLDLSRGVWLYLQYSIFCKCNSFFQNWFTLALIKPFQSEWRATQCRREVSWLFSFLLFIHFEILKMVWINYEIRNTKDTIRRSCIYGAYIKVLKFKNACTPQIYWKMYCN